MGIRTATWAFMSKRRLREQQRVYTVESVALIGTFFVVVRVTTPETGVSRSVENSLVKVAKAMQHLVRTEGRMRTLDWMAPENPKRAV